jgi:hypothetical protein
MTDERRRTIYQALAVAMRLVGFSELEVLGPRLARQIVPLQAHRYGQSHGWGARWEPTAAATCTSLAVAPTTTGELQKS